MPGRSQAFKVDFMQLARSHLEQQPLHYDSTRTWWAWRENRWVTVDETDILESIAIGIGMGDVIFRRIRETLLEALRILARANRPEEPGPRVIQFKNKLYDMERDRWFEPTPSLFITSPIPWDPGDSEETPVIDTLFESWVGPAKEMLLEICAYCLLPSYPIHRFFVLYGDGMNGKTSFLRLLTRFLGQDNVVSTALEKLVSNRFEVARLYRKLCCIIGETSLRVLSKTDVLKRLTGEDLCTGEHKFRDAFDFTNHAKIIVATNVIPVSTDRTTAFYRMAIILDFPNTFEHGRDVVAEIPEQEFRNLATRCISVLRRLLSRGRFSREGEVRERARTYELHSSPVAVFVSERCVEDPSARTPAREFYDACRSWLTRQGLRPLTDREMALQLKTLGCTVRPARLRTSEGSEVARCVFGLRLRE